MEAPKRLILVKGNTVYDLLIHLGIIVVGAFLFVLFFFSSYLPWITSYGESVTVPNLIGMSVDEVAQVMRERRMVFIVKDSTYNKNVKPYTVLNQSPEPGATVKQGRKIYVIVTPFNPPKVRMPQLKDVPFSDAERMLRNLDLEVGRVKYRPDYSTNAVLEQWWKSSEIKAGDSIPKGSKIDLVVGDGLGETEFPVPSLVGLPLDEAIMVIKGSDLQVGTISYEYNSSRDIGTVLRQIPAVRAGRLPKGIIPGSPADTRPVNMIRAGRSVDLWVSGNAAPGAREDDDEDEDDNVVGTKTLEQLEDIQKRKKEKEDKNKKKDE
ncbi:PASTA domain-containing protein [Eisenibacter elegans]|jgi:hypothetical protein|uniref:PASTA domain-containing protein n=1 Tax=Eisenibacter elegans TaxID=997 RepID=UPI000408C029|nr:PASTA domain-containing protein [Eisenibacter elegans]